MAPIARKNVWVPPYDMSNPELQRVHDDLSDFISERLAAQEAAITAAIVAALKPEVFKAPVLENAWKNFGGVFTVAGYMKDPLGFVHLRGVLKEGTKEKAAFTLPAGYRPGAQEIFGGANAEKLGTIEITKTGEVLLDVPSVEYVSLSNITFLAEL